jgi:hypothetical protein
MFLSRTLAPLAFAAMILAAPMAISAQAVQSKREAVFNDAATYIIKAHLCSIGTGNKSYLSKALRDSRAWMIKAGYSGKDADARLRSLMTKLNARDKGLIVPADDRLCRKILSEHPRAKH